LIGFSYLPKKYFPVQHDLLPSLLKYQQQEEFILKEGDNLYLWQKKQYSVKFTTR
jgi:hypothetical protein